LETGRFFEPDPEQPNGVDTFSQNLTATSGKFLGFRQARSYEDFYSTYETYNADYFHKKVQNSQGQRFDLPANPQVDRSSDDIGAKAKFSFVEIVGRVKRALTVQERSRENFVDILSSARASDVRAP
jgi:hypothetical protein